MPDKAIPLLMEAIGHCGETDSATLCHIYLCEAYREKQEYLKGTEILTGILYGEKAISDFNRDFACNRLAAIYNEWANPASSYTDSVFRYSEHCLAISERSGSLPNLAFSQNELSLQYLNKKEYSTALKMSLEAVANFRKAGLIVWAIRNHYFIIE
jgi:hypothetical protein